MDLTFTQYWKELLEIAKDEGINVSELDDLQLAQIKGKAKLYYKKDTTLFDCYENIVDLF